MRIPAVSPDPSGPQAREWLKQELAKAQYRDRTPLTQRALSWLWEQFDQALKGTAEIPLWLSILAALAVAALIVLAVARFRPSRTRTLTGADEKGVLAGVALSAAQLRARAAAAGARGDHRQAVLDWFRALARDAQERGLIADRPGRTAHETAEELCPLFPAQRDELRAAARLFDEVRYGDRTTDAAGARRVATVAQTIQALRPAQQTQVRG